MNVVNVQGSLYTTTRCKATNPQLLPGRRNINGCPLHRVCVHGVCVGVCVFTAVCVHLDGSTFLDMEMIQFDFNSP